jgi:hypothetical protein
MSSSASYVRELTEIRNRFDTHSIEKKERLLTLLLNENKISDRTLLKLHETLLFLRAHPSYKSILKLAEKLQQQTTFQITSSIRRKKTEGVFEQSGIKGTHVVATFTYELLVWLIKEYPQHVYLDSFGATEENASAIIGALLPLPLKENFTDGESGSVDLWMEGIAGKDKRKQLQFLLQLISRSEASLKMAGLIIEQLEVYIKIDLAKLPSRSTLKGPARKIYYHKEPLLKKIDLPSILRSPLPPPTTLKEQQKKQLLQTIRFQLISLYRETDPGTSTDINDITLFQLEHGLDIVLLGMDVEHRTPIDTYIGFFAFKNQMPYAYGGAWLLGSMAKIGLNIFEPYRGGESAWFFSQLMRVYFKEFKPGYFVAEPYQVGRNNPEGIESGAFWFYYKLGYRPIVPAHRKLAEKEYLKLSSKKIKSTSTKILEQLVEEELVLNIDNDPDLLKNKFDTLQLSTSLHQFIRSKYAGNPQTAMDEATATLCADLKISDERQFQSLKQGLEKISIYLEAGGGIKNWDTKEKQLLLQIIEEKSQGTDSHFAKKATSHSSLHTLLNNLAKKKSR